MRDVPSCRAGCLIGDRIIVLDRAASRYFSIAHDAATPSSIPPPPERQAAILHWSHHQRPSLNDARVTWVERPAAAIDQEGRADGSALAQLWCNEYIACRRLRRGIGAGLQLLEETVVGDRDRRAQCRIIRAAQRARRFWSATDRCLPRSIALASLLRARGSDAKLVLGVTAQPFSAHAWVQDGDTVLNDTLDHAALFTPILVA